MPDASAKRLPCAARAAGIVDAMELEGDCDQARDRCKHGKTEDEDGTCVLPYRLGAGVRRMWKWPSSSQAEHEVDRNGEPPCQQEAVSTAARRAGVGRPGARWRPR